MHVTGVIDVCDVTHPCVSWMYVTWVSHTLWCRWDVSFMYTFIHVTLLMSVCDIIIRYLWRGALMCATLMIEMYDMTHWCTWHDSFILIGVFDVTNSYTHSYTWHDSRMYVTWLTHNSMRQDSFIYMTWRMDMRDMIQHDSFIYVTSHIGILMYTDILYILYILFRVRPETIWSVTWIKHDIFRELYMWRHTSMYVARLLHTYDITQWFVWDDSCMWDDYGVATVSRIDKIIGLFCRISSLL